MPDRHDGTNLLKIRLPFPPLYAHMIVRARRAGYELLGEWLSNHPRATESDRRAWHRAANAGTVSAQVADRWCINLLGLTLDELYGPDWDDPTPHTAAA